MVHTVESSLGSTDSASHGSISPSALGRVRVS